MATVKLTGFREGRVSTVGDQDDAQIAGSLTIGDDVAEDTITMNAEFTSDLVPDDDVTYDLGSSSKKWQAGYFGSLNIDQFIYHNGDADTLMKFDDNTIILKAGGKSFIKAEKKGSSPHEVTINDGSNNIDFSVRGNGSNQGNPGMFFDASTNRVGINGVGSPSWELDVAGDIGLAEYIYHRTDTDTYIRFQDNDVRIATAGSERVTVDPTGKVGIGTTNPTSALDINSNSIRIRNTKTPSSASDFGEAGETCWDPNYLYICVATDTWKRIPLDTW